MSGNSSIHGGQYVPMKFTHTGLPRRFVRSIVPPPTWGTTSAGACSPMWNSPAADDPPEGAALADGDPLAPEADGEAAEALGVGVGVVIGPDGCGAGVGAAPGSGAKARIPPSTSSATATPASRPARIDRRGHMLARRVPVPTVGSVPARCTLRFRSHAAVRVHPHA